MLPSGKVAGGAPFNIVNRATHLGLIAEVIGSVGADDLGDDFVTLVQEKRNSIQYIQRHPTLPTSMSIVTVGEGGEPQYDIVHPVAWDDVRVDDHIIKLVRSARSFVYSSLGLRDLRSREALFGLLPHATLKICDVNLREGHYTRDTIMRMLDHADILRMNEYELQQVSDWLGWSNKDREEQLSKIQSTYDYKLIIATLGGEGALCYHKGLYYRQPVFEVDVKDTVGAGDAFLASFIYQYLQEVSIPECLRYACAVGALTASKDGGTPEINASEIEEILLN